MAHQSLYRRYRPRRFDEVRGQDHVTSALRNAVRNQSEGHAYLFSGPRGTGKTSTARILAKALNCENLQNGEPCCDCTPCVDMEAGRSFDLFELDAASNNGVDAVRDLIERTAVGSPGRTKVYILDEVHMLSAGASNALLKTLEEPPEHVRFVLATTDPQKVLPTIRSRTQHFEFQLLSAAELEAQVRWIIGDAQLDVDDAAIGWVVQKGRGSSRDTLSALDQVVAAGGVVVRAEPVEQLYESLVARDTGMAVVAVAEALAQGHDPRVLGSAFLDSLRDAFLVSLDVDVPHLMEHDRAQYQRWAAELGTPTLTRAMDAIGTALVEMRQAADPRVPLEVALVRLTSAGDSSLAALAERLDRLEQAIAAGTAGSGAGSTTGTAAAPTPAAAPADPAAATTTSADATPSSTGGGPAQARAALAKLRADAAAVPQGAGGETGGSSTPTRPAPPVPPATGAAPAPPPATPAERAQEPVPEPPEVQEPVPPPSPRAAAVDGADDGLPSVDELSAAFDTVIVPAMKGVAKAIYGGGSVASIESGTVVFALALGAPIDRAERSRPEVEAALATHFGRPVPLRLVEDGDAPRQGGGGPGSATGERPSVSGGAVDLTEIEDPMTIDVTQLENADDVAETGVDRLTRAFPGAQLIDEDEVAR